MDIYERMSDLGIVLPPPPTKGGLYSPVVEFSSNLIYMSGCGSTIRGDEPLIGKLGRELSLKQGQMAARNCILNMLAVMDGYLGSLNRIKNLVKMLAFVSSDPDFFDQPQVVDAASSLLIEIFGDIRGSHARSAVGTNVLPGNIPVEIEILAEIE